MKNSLPAFALILGIVLAPVAFAQDSKPNPALQKIAAEISAKRIEATLRKLVSFETRNSLSDTKSETP